ncbi:MAG: hypothetical protein ABGX63_05740 [bacterium]
MLYLDLETRSQEDLLKHGLARYAIHLTTQVICMAYAFDDEPVQFWWGRDLTPEVWPDWNIVRFPQSVLDHFEAGLPVMAHNAEFEKWLFDFVISGDYDFDAPSVTQWRCSMALALASGFAGALDVCSQQIGLTGGKHKAGTRLIKEYCAPGFLAEFKDGDAERMKDYCILDVELMRAVAKSCRPFTNEEWYEYHLNLRLNEKGLPIDPEFADAALGYATEVADDANQHISNLTDGKMTKHTQRKSRDEWLFPKLTEYQMKLLVVYKKGIKKISLDSDHRQYLLNCEDLDADARELLDYIGDAGSAALKKYSVAHHQHVSGRVHNTFLWNGAGRTGRFSGKGLQPHNFRRDVFGNNQATALIADIKQQLVIDSPASTMARLLRAMIYNKAGLYWCDWSAIEGRVAAWLSRSDKGEAKLQLYRDGRDVYVVTAAGMFGVTEAEVDDPLRQNGKIAELALQFGGGKGALIGMAKNYGVTFEDEYAQTIVDKWRVVNPWATTIWARYQNAIDNAVKHPMSEYKVGRVSFYSDGVRFLFCMLPSGRLLTYPWPKEEYYETPWGEDRFGPTFQVHFKSAAGEPPLRNYARGALIFQNTVQAVAADLLRESLVEADLEGLGIIGHVHDEIIGEGSVADGEALNRIMLEVPWWADGLPLATGGVKHGERYGK